MNLITGVLNRLVQVTFAYRFQSSSGFSGRKLEVPERVDIKLTPGDRLVPHSATLSIPAENNNAPFKLNWY